MNVPRLITLPAGRRAKWIVLVAWLAAAAALGPLQARLQDSTTNSPREFLPADAESTRVLELLENEFPSGRQTPAIVVYRNAAGLSEANRAKIAADLDELSEPGRLAGTDAIQSPFAPGARERGLVSGDRTTALAVVQITAETIEGIEPVVDELRTVVGGPGSPGLEAYVTGPAGFAVDAVDVFGQIDGTLLVASTVLILTLLVAIYRSPLVAVVPLAVVAVAYAIAAGFVYVLVSRAGLTVNGQTTGLLVILMFGAGTDYALLLVSRFREELRRHEDTHAAIAEALGRTSPAILSSGATTTLAMLVLLVASMASTSAAGPVLALGVAITMIAGLTLLPAVLAVLGRRAFWPFIPRFGTEVSARVSVWGRIGRRVERRPLTALLATVALLGLLALGNLVSLPGLSLVASFRSDTESVSGARAVELAFPAGEVAPTDVIVRADAPALAGAAREVSAALGRVAGVAAVAPVEESVGGDALRLRVTLDSDPYGDPAISLVDPVRDAAAAAATGAGADVLVGGPTAEEADTQDTVRSDALLIVPLTLAVVFVILVLLLRAVLAPLYLAASQILSFAATLGLASLAFEYLFDAPGTDASLPTFVFIFTVALGIDYSIFLMSRIREETPRWGPREGVLVGLDRTGGVISSAGIILAGTFAVLMTLPLEVLFQLGFAVAVGLLIDTFVVRPLFVPAVGLLLGRYSWWPGRLARTGATTPLQPSERE
ncbi:MAG: MMPL family transporter [Thermoleophilia bacterium]|nr:MMPL family transporter [Thermoleophilia bacterium]